MSASLWSFASVRSSSPELDGTRSVTGAILEYARAHDGRLPESLGDLDAKQIYLRDGVSLEMFIYVAPDGATTDLPGDTPIILLPMEGGIYIGYIDWHSRFETGGYSSEHPRLIETQLRFYKNIFGLTVLAFVAIIPIVNFATRKSYPTLMELVTIIVILVVVATLLPSSNVSALGEFVFFVVITPAVLILGFVLAGMYLLRKPGIIGTPTDSEPPEQGDAENGGKPLGDEREP